MITHNWVQKCLYQNHTYLYPNFVRMLNIDLTDSSITIQSSCHTVFYKNKNHSGKVHVSAVNMVRCSPEL